MSEVQQELTAWLEDFARAVREQRYDRGRELFSEDVVSFGTVAAKEIGLDDLETNQWRNVWSDTEGFRFAFEQMEWDPMGEGAWVAVPWQSRGFRDDGTGFPRRGRATLILKRSEGGWVAVHSHFSQEPITS